MARLVSGRQVDQLRFLRTGFAGWVRLASLLLSCAVSIESMAIFAESADAMVGTLVTCFFVSTSVPVRPSVPEAAGLPNRFVIY